MRYAQSTTVTVERSRAEIENILGRYGASKFAYFSEKHRAMVAFEIKGKRIRFIIPLADKSETRFNRKKYYNSSRQMTPEESQKVWEQACRQKWRSLSLIIKAKLEAVLGNPSRRSISLHHCRTASTRPTTILKKNSVAILTLS